MLLLVFFFLGRFFILSGQMDLDTRADSSNDNKTDGIPFCLFCWESTGVSIQPFQTPPMSRPRFHSHTESLVRSGAQQQQQQQLGGLGLQNFNLLPVKDTNGRNGSSGNKKIAIDEDDIIPVKEAPLSAPPTVVASTNSSPVPSRQQVIPAEKEIIIVDKDFDDKIKSISYPTPILSSVFLI